MFKASLMIFSSVIMFQLVAESRPFLADVCVHSTLKVNHVQGHVVINARGFEEPIPRAEVELKEYRNDEWQTKYKATTDDKGSFKIKDVLSGKYEIHVAHPMLGSFGTMVRVKRKAVSNPSKEIIIVLEFMKCGDARVQKIREK